MVIMKIFSGTLHPQKLALTLPACGGRSVGIVRSRTQATEFVCSVCGDVTLCSPLKVNRPF
jgi:hypothetical protein